MLTIDQIETRDQIAAVQELLREYTAWAFSLEPGSDAAPTFQGLEKELTSLPGIYRPPGGCLLLAVQDGQPAGCIAFKPLDSTTCELKRLYVRPAFRGLHLGRQLVSRLIDEARRSGYKRMALDSHI